jgi:hypothetical protein
MPVWIFDRRLERSRTPTLESLCIVDLFMSSRRDHNVERKYSGVTD